MRNINQRLQAIQNIQFKGIAVLLILLFFVGTCFCDESQSKQTEFNEKTSPPNIDKARYPAFKLTNHALQRDMVMKLWRKDFREAQALTGEKVKVYIALEDICDDERKEIIAHFVHPFYCGSHGCTLLIYEWIENEHKA